MTAVDDKGGGACKIGRRTTRGKEENGRQTTTALDKRLISPPGREREKIKNSSLCKKTFFNNTVRPVGFFTPAKTANVPFLVYQSYMWSFWVVYKHSPSSDTNKKFNKTKFVH
jgi:hypothetical protein